MKKALLFVIPMLLLAGCNGEDTSTSSSSSLPAPSSKIFESRFYKVGYTHKNDESGKAVKVYTINLNDGYIKLIEDGYKQYSKNGEVKYTYQNYYYVDNTFYIQPNTSHYYDAIFIKSDDILVCELTQAGGSSGTTHAYDIYVTYKYADQNSYLIEGMTDTNS